MSKSKRDICISQWRISLYFLWQNWLLPPTNSFSLAVKSLFNGYIHYAPTKTSPSNHKFFASRFFALLVPSFALSSLIPSAALTVSQYAEVNEYRCSKAIQHWYSAFSNLSPSSSLLYVEKNILTGIYVYDLYTVTTEKQIGLKEIVAWNTNVPFP